MNPYHFTDEDLSQISSHGLCVEMVKKQLGRFKKPPPYIQLLAPCTIEDGIRRIDHQNVQNLTKTYELEAQKGRCLKFIPASGAASRMFNTLLKVLSREEDIHRDVISAQARAGDPQANEILEFMHHIKRFAFFKDLRSVMEAQGINLDALLEKGQFTEIIRFLLLDKGLNYRDRPKALLKFHDYPEESRTAFEEHLAEAVQYIADKDKRCSLHFTVSEAHLQDFQELLERLRPNYQKRYAISYQVDFSFQKKSTDTIAVDLKNRPFREKNGRLLFRPGGHGSLIENLNDLKGDILFIKNVDNVACDRFKAPATLWKKFLGGYLIHMQSRIFGYEQKLSSGEVSRAFLGDVVDFVREELLMPVPYVSSEATSEKLRVMLLEKLRRPLRVCGMVRNVGAPGGGPFWVKNRDGERSLQIVEKAQIDPDSEAQQAILAASTHFNSVDLVCGIRDRQGRPFDLRRYVDADAVFISRKSEDGRDLKALEHPGLWNGAMARWITLFVEVPDITFNPVKTVNDLLREAHQP